MIQNRNKIKYRKHPWNQMKKLLVIVSEIKRRHNTNKPKTTQLRIDWIENMPVNEMLLTDSSVKWICSLALINSLTIMLWLLCPSLWFTAMLSLPFCSCFFSTSLSLFFDLFLFLDFVLLCPGFLSHSLRCCCCQQIIIANK